MYKPHGRVHRRAAAVIAAVVAVVVVAACSSSPAGSGASPTGLTPVSIALSWTPNTDYTGMYVAQALGYYTKAGIDLKIIPYASTAPETLVAHQVADFGYSYQAGVAYARAAGHDIVSVFAPDQGGTYAIGVRANRTDITSPKDLDGKVYAGFGTPDEKPELRYVIRHAGGTGTFTEYILNTASYDAVWSGKADFTIPVVTWDGVQAALAGKPMKYFSFTDYGFPDQYSVLIATSNAYLHAHPSVARAFLAATAAGYAYAAHHPRAAAALVIKENPGAFPNPQLVYRSQALLASGGYLTTASGQVGTQSAATWTKYGNFLYDNHLLTDSAGHPVTAPPTWSDYYTNAYLPTADQ